MPKNKNVLINSWVSRVALLWAGVCLGGNIIAAMAKFQVASLPLSTALEIGQVTFRSVGALEACLCVALFVFLCKKNLRFRYLGVIPVLLFGVQWLAVMPVLHARTIAVITGSPVPHSNAHILYIILEVAKICFLIVAGCVQVIEEGD